MIALAWLAFDVISCIVLGIFAALIAIGIALFGSRWRVLYLVPPEGFYFSARLDRRALGVADWTPRGYVSSRARGYTEDGVLFSEPMGLSDAIEYLTKFGGLSIQSQTSRRRVYLSRDFFSIPK